MKKSIKITLIMVIAALCLIRVVSAALFDVQAATCRPSWFCTIYSQSNCGNRTCIDINGCGVNLDKPTEYLECQAPASTDGSGGGSNGGMRGVSSLDLMPSGYFTIDTSLMKISIEQEKVIQKIISINASYSGEYRLDIQYPSSYTKGTDFISTSMDSKHIDNTGTFNIIIDARSILVGTYVIPLRIYDDDNYSKTTILIIDVVPKNNPVIKLYLDSNIKTLGVDKSIDVRTTMDGVKLNTGDKLTYSIIDPKGNVLSMEDKTVDNPLKIQDTISLPEIIDEGYYTLSVGIESLSGTYTKSEVFTVLTPNKYLPVTQNPKNINGTSNIIIWIIVIIIAAITFINAGLFYKSYKSRRHRASRGITMLKLSMGRPSIRINFGGGNIKRLSERMFGKAKGVDADRKLELLKKSYERGFISLKEYRDTLKDQGYTVEGNKIAEYYDELKNREKVEDALIHNGEGERKITLDIEKEQREVREKAEADVLEQEEKLRKELEHEKEKREREEKRLAEEKAEKERAEDERRKAEIDARKQEAERIEDSIGQFVEKTVVNPLAGIIQKENILDKRVEDRAFVLENGERLYCIRDLLNSLPQMSEYVFAHHTKHGRNDFANWIGDVFHYYDVAEQVREADAKEKLIKVLKQYE